MGWDAVKPRAEGQGVKEKGRGGLDPHAVYPAYSISPRCVLWRKVPNGFARIRVVPRAKAALFDRVSR